MILVVGATGLVGSEVCRLLSESGSPVRGLVRRTSNPERLAQLSRLGVELAWGDLKDGSSLRDACRGAKTVVSTASSTISRQDGDSIASVDHQGQLDLIDAAEAAGASRFVLTSFPHAEFDFPLQDAKRAVEERLRRGRMAAVILQPTCYMEIWLSPALGFDPANSGARIFGTGQNKLSWISFLDVAACAAAAARSAESAAVPIKLGGPDAMSPLEVVRAAERILGKPCSVEHVPEEALRAQLGAATDPMQQSFAGLMLYCACGDVIDPAEAQRLLNVRPQRSVGAFLQASLGPHST